MKYPCWKYKQLGGCKCGLKKISVFVEENFLMLFKKTERKTEKKERKRGKSMNSSVKSLVQRTPLGSAEWPLPPTTHTHTHTHTHTRFPSLMCNLLRVKRMTKLTPGYQAEKSPGASDHIALPGKHSLGPSMGPASCHNPSCTPRFPFTVLPRNQGGGVSI